jgi:hypothetical protein
MRKATLWFGIASPGDKKSPRIQRLSLIFTQHRSACHAPKSRARIRPVTFAEIVGHDAETIGHDAEMPGHDAPKYPAKVLVS